MSQDRQQATSSQSAASSSHEEAQHKKASLGHMLAAAEAAISRDLFPILHPIKARRAKQAQQKAAHAAEEKQRAAAEAKARADAESDAKADMAWAQHMAEVHAAEAKANKDEPQSQHEDGDSSSRHMNHDASTSRPDDSQPDLMQSPTLQYTLGTQGIATGNAWNTAGLVNQDQD